MYLIFVRNTNKKIIVMRCRFFIVSAILLGSGLFAKQLTYDDVRKTMREMFYYHVNYKELTPQLVKRSFKVYMEQFDSDKVYLLKSEADPFLELSSSQVQAIIKHYNRDDFEAYARLNHTLSDSIKRSRRLRAELEKEIMAGKAISFPAKIEYQDYATSEAELKERLIARLYFMMKREKKSLTRDTAPKALSLWDKRFRRREAPYVLFNDQGAPLPHPQVEHNVTFHTLKAYARSLDAHTGYFSPDEAYEIRASLKKQLEGIGVVLRESVDGIYIADLIESGPAFQSGGVEVGDILVEVNGRAVPDMSFEEVLEELKGEAGSRLQLVIQRGAQSHHIALKRERIPMLDEMVQYSAEPYADGVIGKITLPAFYDNGKEISAEKHLREALKELRNQGELRGLVIDMRENAGGFLTQAVKIAGMFITRGVIVISKYAEGEVQYMRNLDGRVFYDGPLVLLTSKASASAAEIVAAALQDYGVALVVGDERTYGKGSMQYQTITDSSADAFYKVTVGRYYTVSGKSTQIDGVPGDVLIPTRYSPYNIGERYLEYPLSSDRLAAAYVDPLTGIDPKSQQMLQQKYVPYIQQRERRWRKMLPSLKRNSKKRIAGNANYQCYLSIINGKDTKCTLKNNFGVADLQMTEAVNVVKDMISLAQKSH